jgi:energy-coupling factor transporter transmembrane protein EcfT
MAGLYSSVYRHPPSIELDWNWYRHGGYGWHFDDGSRENLGNTASSATFRAFAGIKFSGQSPLWQLKIAAFSSSAANVTFQHLFPFLLIMVLGLLLPATTSQLRMKQGLEQAMNGLRKIGIPVEALSLATSLTLRFIPIIMEELQRFSRIAQSRQPQKRRRRGISLRDIPAMIIPLLLSILAIGDELATALEARGYRAVGQTRTRSVQLQFTRGDWILIGITLLTSLTLLLFRF